MFIVTKYAVALAIDTFMKILIIFLFIIFPGFGLFAQPYDMILVGDPVLEDLRYLSLESGKSFLSFTPPLAPDEVKIFLDSIDASLLSAPALEAFYRANSRLSPASPLTLSSDNFALSLNINSTIEARARFNRDVSWEPEHPRIPPALSLPFRFFFADSLQLYFEPIFAVDPEYYHSAEILGLNIPLEADGIDASMPLRAFLAAGGAWWNFQLGRDRLSYGTGRMGNLAVSDSPDYYEFARLSLFSRFIKYSVLINQMPLQITDDLYQFKDPQADNFNRTMQRHFYLHRIDVNLFDRLSIGLMEGLMAGNSPLEIRYLNPMMIFHSFYSGWNYDYWPERKDEMGHMNGSIFSVEVNWNVIKALAVYGQFVMNDFATKHELSINPNQPPNGLGYLAGIRYAHSFDNWAAVFFFEFIYTDPYLYMNSSPFASFIHMRYLSLWSGRAWYSYTGYPRDTIALSLGANFFKGSALSFAGEFSWLSRGEHNKYGIVWDWQRGPPATLEKTPSGIAEDNFVMSLAAQWKLFSYFAMNFSIAGIFSHNNDHIAGTNELGGQAAFSVAFSY